MKRRRADVETLVSTRRPAAATTVNPDDAWLESHSKELAFQKQKQDVNEVEAYENGHLLPEERQPNLDVRLTAFQIARAKQ